MEIMQPARDRAPRVLCRQILGDADLGALRHRVAQGLADELLLLVAESAQGVGEAGAEQGEEIGHRIVDAGIGLLDDETQRLEMTRGGLHPLRHLRIDPLGVAHRGGERDAQAAR